MSVQSGIGDGLATDDIKPWKFHLQQAILAERCWSHYDYYYWACRMEWHYKALTHVLLIGNSSTRKKFSLNQIAQDCNWTTGEAWQWLQVEFMSARSPKIFAPPESG